jgi:hypothetical protein
MLFSMKERKQMSESDISSSKGKKERGRGVLRPLSHMSNFLPRVAPHNPARTRVLQSSFNLSPLFPLF